MDSLFKHFAALTRPAFQRHGFASEQLVAQWPAIVGEGPATYAKPERIKWPRTSELQKQKLGGTLVLRAPAAFALDIHYDVPRLIERVNQFLGYGAISTIKIIKEADVPAPKPVRQKPAPMARTAWLHQITGIAEPELQESLAKLASESSPKGPTHTSFSTGENRRFEPPSTSSRKLT